MANENLMSAKRSTNWMKCCLCQTDTKEPLQSPPIHHVSQHDGYKTIATNIPLFHKINKIPMTLDLERLDEGGGIEATLRRYQVKYHYNCRLRFNNTKLLRAKKPQSDAQCSETDEGQTKRRRTMMHKSLDDQVCFLCDNISPKSDLRQVMTMHLNDRLHECAQTLNDGKLLAQLSGADAIAQELKYHHLCLIHLYNREKLHLKRLEKESQSETVQPVIFPMALSELVTYIVETSLNSDGPSAFRHTDMCNLYQQPLDQLGVHSLTVNSTRLREKLLAEIPELTAHKQGRDVLLAFQKHVGLALSQASEDSEALIMAKAAKILISHILDHKSRFDGTFHEGK